MICFVILHYKSIEETLECLNDLKETFDSKDYKTIIVDNNSLKDEELKKISNYTDDIIKLDKNYGFAKANNKGCNYAKEKYNPDFIAIINNDVFITQKDFINIINNDYKKYNFDLLGPYIESPSKESSNPFPVYDTEEKINKEIVKTNKLIKIYNSPILYFLLQVYLKIKHPFKIKKDCNGKKLEKNVALHGCCIIVSKKYYEKYNDIFYNETFLFHEEEFLYQRIINDKLISIYDPNLKCYHKEGSSTKKDKKNKRNSKLFREKERMNSLKLLKNYFSKGGNE